MCCPIVRPCRVQVLELPCFPLDVIDMWIGDWYKLLAMFDQDSVRSLCILLTAECSDQLAVMVALLKDAMCQLPKLLHIGCRLATDITPR